MAQRGRRGGRDGPAGGRPAGREAPPGRAAPRRSGAGPGRQPRRGEQRRGQGQGGRARPPFFSLARSEGERAAGREEAAARGSRRAVPGGEAWGRALQCAEPAAGSCGGRAAPRGPPAGPGRAVPGWARPRPPLARPEAPWAPAGCPAAVFQRSAAFSPLAVPQPARSHSGARGCPGAVGRAQGHPAVPPAPWGLPRSTSSLSTPPGPLAVKDCVLDFPLLPPAVVALPGRVPPQITFYLFACLCIYCLHPDG